MNPVTIYRDFSRKVGQVGIPAAISHGFKRLVAGRPKIAPDDFDERYGTDTASVVTVGELGLPDSSNRYETASVPFAEYFNELRINHADYSFVDIGSGKGRALMEASRYRFRKIVGVELSRHLHRIALCNIAIWNDLHSGHAPMCSVCEDATEFHLPTGPHILYLYNPFGRGPMEALVRHLEKFDVRYVLYRNATQRAVWDACPRFRHRATVAHTEIYESCS